jgi:hypothetical protein
MAKNHEPVHVQEPQLNLFFPCTVLAAEMLTVEVKIKEEDGNATRDTHHVNLKQAYRKSGQNVRVMQKTSTGFCCGSSAVILLEVTYDYSLRRPDFLFCCFIEVTYDCNEVCKGWSERLRV